MEYAGKQYVITFDPGKVNDPAAVQVYRAVHALMPADNVFSPTGRVLIKDDLVMQYQVQEQRHTETARFVANLMRREALVDNAILVFDATGVGQAVKDILHDEGIRDMLPIVYTAGGSVTMKYADATQDRRFAMGGQSNQFVMKILEEVHVPKNDMVDAARLALECGEIRIAADLPYAKEFKVQMVNFTGKMNKKGYTSYNNASDDIHDEWVNCMMMRSWYRHRFRKTLDRLQGAYDKKEEIADILGIGTGTEAGRWL